MQLWISVVVTILHPVHSNSWPKEVSSYAQNFTSFLSWKGSQFCKYGARTRHGTLWDGM